MNNHKEIHAALADGKTLVNSRNSQTAFLKPDGNMSSDTYFAYPENWDIKPIEISKEDLAEAWDNHVAGEKPFISANSHSFRLFIKQLGF